MTVERRCSKIYVGRVIIIVWLNATLAVIFGLLCLMVSFNWFFAILATFFGIMCIQAIRSEE